MVERPTRCVFCNGSPLTEEHVLGKWSKRVVPRTMPNYKQLQAIQHATHSDFQVRPRAGDPRSLKVTCVCCKCNSGWMGAIQEGMKPFGIAMAQGKTIKLNPTAQLAIATWAAMITMTAEYDNPPTVAVPQDNREFFYKNKYPPPSFRIWVGHLPRKEKWINWAHHPFAIVEDDDALPGGALANLNSVTSTHVLGEFFVHIMSCPDLSILRRWQLPSSLSSRLIQIWPLIHGDVFWPPLRELTSETASVTAASFFDFLVLSRRRWRIRRGLDPNG
jgi:hypothetical protein